MIRPEYTPRNCSTRTDEDRRAAVLHRHGATGVIRDHWRAGLSGPRAAVDEKPWQPVEVDIWFRRDRPLNPDAETSASRDSEWEADDAHPTGHADGNSGARRPGVMGIHVHAVESGELKRDGIYVPTVLRMLAPARSRPVIEPFDLRDLRSERPGAVMQNCHLSRHRPNSRREVGDPCWAEWNPRPALLLRRAARLEVLGDRSEGDLRAAPRTYLTRSPSSWKAVPYGEGSITWCPSARRTRRR